MKRIVRMLYIIVLSVMIVVTGSVIVELAIFRTILQQSISREVELEKDLISDTLETKLRLASGVVSSASAAAGISSEEGLFGILKELLERNTQFDSLYYLSKDNKMVNASGFSPPEDMDMRERPWYKKAVEENGPIYTDAYLNASGDALIVTVAEPVYDSENEFLGVAAGDIYISDMLGFTMGLLEGYDRHFVITDSAGTVLAQNGRELSDLTPVNVSIAAGSMAEYILGDEDGMTGVTVDGRWGYFAYETIPGTDWRTGSFIAVDEKLISGNRLFPVILSIIFSVFVVTVLLIIFQRKLITEPILDLDADISRITPDMDTAVKLHENPRDPFYGVRKTINILLDKISCSIESVKKSNMELESKNLELKKTMEQLSNVENQLRKQYESLYISRAQLKASEERNTAILNALPDTVLRIDTKKDRVDFIARDESDIFKNRRDPHDLKIEEVFPEDTLQITLDSISKARESNATVEYETEYEGNSYEIRMVSSRSDEVIAVIRNVTEEKNNIQCIEFLSYHDQLTGLLNRRYFEENKDLISANFDIPISIAMLDVNGLKLINDAFGHSAGDSLLQYAAEALKKVFRPEDLLLRIGGDEFVIIMPATSSDEALKLCDDAILAAQDFKVKGLPVSLSIGVDTKSSRDTSFNEIMSSAEEKLYAKKLTESQEMRQRAVEKIMGTIYERNSWEKRHAENVSRISRMLADEMGLSYETVNKIESAGLLHDIGKIAVKDEYLERKSESDENAINGFKKHPEIGYQILKAVDKLSGTAEYVLSHHERWDGYGYPRGLKGHDIPLPSRIIAVAEVFDAFTSGRAKGKPVSGKQALDMIRARSGSKFDPSVVKALENIFPSISNL